MLFTPNVKKTKGAAYKNADVHGKWKQTLSTNSFPMPIKVETGRCN